MFPLLLAPKGKQLASQFSTFLRNHVPCVRGGGGGNLCWCVAHTIRGRCRVWRLLVSGWLLSWLTAPEFDGGVSHNFVPASHATRHWFRALLRRYTQASTQGGEVLQGWRKRRRAWSVSQRHMRGKRWENGSYGKGRKSAANVNNRMQHFLPLVMFPDSWHANCLDGLFDCPSNKSSVYIHMHVILTLKRLYFNLRTFGVAQDEPNDSCSESSITVCSSHFCHHVTKLASPCVL